MATGLPETDLTEAQRGLRDRARSWAEGKLAPNGRQWEEDKRLPDDLYDEAGKLGWMGLVAPEDEGGTAADTVATGLALGEIACGDSAAGLSLGAHNVLALNHVQRAAEGKLRERWLPRMAQGEALGAWGLTEPGGGSDVLGMDTTVREDEGELVLDGEKCFITNGSRADVAVVVAADDRGGYSAVLVPADTPGFEASREHDLVCMKASDTAVLRFDQARVPTSHLLGEQGSGLADAFACLNLERVVMAAISTHTAGHMLERALDHAQESSTAEDPTVYRPLARLRTEVEASWGLWMRAAKARDRGQLDSGQAAEAKLFATELAQRAARKAVKLHGVDGLEREVQVERAVRDGLLGPVGGGTTEMQEIVVARGMGIDADPY